MSIKKIFLIALLISTGIYAQKKAETGKVDFNDIKLRNIGPAFMSGRIADVAIHPQNPNIWYVAAGSGGVWKTVNAGTTWQPVFDGQKSFSIGCVTIDPNNPHRIWVGTGENVGGRHVGFGDGIYLSTDDGKTWKNMGLKKSEHISKIIVRPGNSEIVYVAVQGPLWSKGGERGFYKTTDGGKTWKKTLGDNEWEGVTDIAIDPRNPDRIYAATWQRHRTVAAYMGGGPKTAIYRSEDAGDTWKKIMKGMPKGKKGKIGLAVSPIKPDVIYAAVELNRKKGAFFKSTNRGESWQKQSDKISGGTGPHYYQEIYADPHRFDRVYFADVRMQITDDGGKSFYQMPEKFKHSDNHVLKFRKDNPNYLLVGTDGGLYESFDLGQSWRHIDNLPLTQFYKIAVDDSKPFYYIYGGTQDNSTERGPSRTDNLHGIANRDWQVVLFADGHQPATEPGNPNIVYAEWQEGSLVRKDMKTGEMIFIQPQPRAGEPFERYNWDAPILVSPHNPKRLYYGSYRVWRSDNRGDEWHPISGDLTKHQERFDLPIMGNKQSWDSPWDVYAMSTFNTITSLSESPVQEGLIYAGTDDGLIQITENGGKTWQKIPVEKLPGVPKNAFVNDIKADNFDANTVYVCLDAHKQGNFTPYLYKSTNKGKTWQKLSTDLPKPLIVWRFVQDYKNPNLMFIGTEFGIYTSLNGGKKWHKLNAGANISFRDLAIKKDDDDLVGASFGRGIFILDDYGFLRKLSEKLPQSDKIFKPRDSWWYFERGILGREKKGSQGASYFLAPNPDYGTTFTYYLKNSFESLAEKRQKIEKKAQKEGKPLDFPSWDKLDAEVTENKPVNYLYIIDDKANILNRLRLSNKKGFHRVTWNHTKFSKIIDKPHANSKGVRVAPGTYKAYIAQLDKTGKINILSDTISFKVKRLYQNSLPGKPLSEVAAFWDRLDALGAQVNQFVKRFKKTQKAIEILQKAGLKSDKENDAVYIKLLKIKKDLQNMETQLFGRKSKNEVGEKNTPTIFDYLNHMRMSTGNSSYGPTPETLKSYQIVQNNLKNFKSKLNHNIEQLRNIQKDMKQLNIPYIDTGLCPE